MRECWMNSVSAIISTSTTPIIISRDQAMVISKLSPI